MDAADRYAELAAVIEAELVHVQARDLAALPGLKARRAEIVRTLPTTPPAGAGEALARCAQLQRRIGDELTRWRLSLLSEISQLTRTTRAAAGYRPAIARGHRVDAAA